MRDGGWNKVLRGYLGPAVTVGLVLALTAGLKVVGDPRPAKVQLHAATGGLLGRAPVDATIQMPWGDLVEARRQNGRLIFEVTGLTPERCRALLTQGPPEAQLMLARSREELDRQAPIPGSQAVESLDRCDRGVTAIRKAVPIVP